MGTPGFPQQVVVEARETAAGVRLTLRGLPDDGPVLDELRRETILGALLAADVRTPVFLERERGGAIVLLGAPEVTQHAVKQHSAPGSPPRRGLAPGKPRTTARLPLGGALVGFRIAVSAGHGWLDNGDGIFSTQRSRHEFTGCGGCRGITEDFFTGELATNQVIPLLQQMGAEVILVREPDHDVGDPAIVDDGDGGYAETSGTWADGSSAGVGFGDDYRTNADTDPGGAAFMLAPSVRPRRVAVRFPEGANRTAGAVLSVVHEGGVRTFSLDQRRMGRFWLDLGAYPFGSGGALELAAGPSAGVLVADAVKVGGGLHPASRYPWWQMSASLYVPEAGAPGSVTGLNDVIIRPGYAELVGPDLYVSLHANASGVAGGSSAHGTSSYRYSCSSYGDHTSSDGATTCDDPPGSRDLLDLVHASVLAALRAGWDPGWADRGRLVANFGEVRELDDTPGVLVETAFFDNYTTPAGVVMSDNQALHDPRWREAFARGLAAGIAGFLTPGTDAPPERPEGVSARNLDDGTLLVSWRPVPGATGYRVTRARLDSTRGRGFDEGTVVEGATELVLASPVLEPGLGYAFRVAALDDDGEGLASQAVVARFRGEAGRSAPLLVLWAYDRRDAWVQDVDNDLQGAIEHGRALMRSLAHDGPDVYFDGALDEALELALPGAIVLDDYLVVDFAAGKDSTFHEPLSAAQQDALAAFLDSGGRAILSGEEIGYALVETAPDLTGATFLSERFSAGYVSDDADTFTIAGSGILAGLDGSIDDGAGLYQVVYPDVWQAEGTAVVPLSYPDGGAAAVLGDGTALFGFGLEALVDDEARALVFARLLTELVPELFDDGGEGEGEGEGTQGVPLVTLLPPPGGCGCDGAPASSATALVVLTLLRALRRLRC